MYCSNCGNYLEDDSRFCNVCGAPQQTDAAPQPQQIPRPQQVPQPQPQQAPGAYHLYMDPQGLTLMNYKFDITDAAGYLRYRAATVTESLFTCNARIYYPNDAEAVIIRQQTKMTLASMNFDLLAPNGALITEMIQHVHMTTSEFQLPQLGLAVTGDFLSHEFTFWQAGQAIASVRKKIFSWGDRYELEYFDPSLEQILLAAIMAIQMVIALSRSRARARRR